MKKLSSLICGLYFIRFALVLWIFPAAISLLDWVTPAAIFTRGIMTPESVAQAFSAAFMLVSAGVVALLNVRLIAINGHERFAGHLQDHDWLRRFAGRRRLPLWLFLVAHAPGLAAIGYLEHNMRCEQAPVSGRVGFLTLGVLAAYAFWLLVGLIYLWSFDEAQLGGRLPSRLIFPNRLIPLSSRQIRQLVSEPPPLLATWLRPLFQWIANIGGAGFANPAGVLYEGHRLAAVSINGLLALYIYLFAFTAPVPWHFADVICNLGMLLLTLLAAIGAGWGRRPATTAARIVKVVATVFFLAFAALILYFWSHGIHAPRGFSVLGSVLVLVIGLLWILSTIAFAVDSSRFPVFSGSLLLLLVIKMICSAEHYFTIIESAAPYSPAPQPEQVLARFMLRPQPAKGPYLPLIVITAEGGGIHSAAWTATVMMELEHEFAKVKDGRPFHDNILLASTVSGGSVGILPFLREYAAVKPFDALPDDSLLLHDRVIESAGCSSLQAVTWGLTYYDILNFLQPATILRPAAGSAGGPGYDRSWALETAFNRNLTDRYCISDPRGPLRPDPGSDFRSLHEAAEMLEKGRVPAFTFNTTAVESGGRFLLSNYELESPFDANEASVGKLVNAGKASFPHEKVQTDAVPAESFLHAFAHDDVHVKLAACARKAYADLPLATAARMSGTFPYVSSASRIPAHISDSGYHFVDGGYFDNDGTSSAIEFLHFAVGALNASKMPSPKTAAAPQAKPNQHHSTLKPARPSPRRKLPILFIEIRNDFDLYTASSGESFEKQGHLEQRPRGQDPWRSPLHAPPLWNAVDQLEAPLEAFWHAGHDSDTLRNRRELCMFENAYSDRFIIHHMVFDYRNTEDEKNQPLSWDLTPNQMKNVRCALDPHLDGCRGIEGEQKTEGDKDATISQMAHDAALWFNNRKIYGSSDTTCASWGAK